MATTLFALRSDDGGIFDASSSVSLKTAGARPGLRADRAFTLAKTTRVSIAPTEAFDALGTFTLALVVTPENLRVNQVLVDSERPPVRLTLVSDGTRSTRRTAGRRSRRPASSRSGRRPTSAWSVAIAGLWCWSSTGGRPASWPPARRWCPRVAGA